MDEFDRPWAVGMDAIPLHITALSMVELTAALGGTEEDYGKVKTIERLMWPAIQKQHEKTRKK